MKRHGILNAEVNYLLSLLGHTDGLVICDAGLPIPAGARRVDLSLVPGVPGFLQVLEAVAAELSVERLVLAEEMQSANPGNLAGVQRLFPGISAVFVPHAEFKRIMAEAKGFIRTGECTPYSNVILYSGVKGVFPE